MWACEQCISQAVFHQLLFLFPDGSRVMWWESANNRLTLWTSDGASTSETSTTSMFYFRCRCFWHRCFCFLSSIISHIWNFFFSNFRVWLVAINTIHANCKFIFGLHYCDYIFLYQINKLNWWGSVQWPKRFKTKIRTFIIWTFQIRLEKFIYFITLCIIIVRIILLEFLNVYESFTLVFTKITRHRTPSTERDEGMQL